MNLFSLEEDFTANFYDHAEFRQSFCIPSQEMFAALVLEYHFHLSSKRAERHLER